MYSSQVYERTSIEKTGQEITNRATAIGERAVPEDEWVEVVDEDVDVGLLAAGVVTVVLPPDGFPVPDDAVGASAASVLSADGAGADAFLVLLTVTASFIPLPQWPTTAHTK